VPGRFEKKRNVAGELDKALAVTELFNRTYPRYPNEVTLNELKPAFMVFTTSGQAEAFSLAHAHDNNYDYPFAC
jgi:hypothetical protein